MKLHDYGEWTIVWTAHEPDFYYPGHLNKESKEIHQYAREQQVYVGLVCYTHIIHGDTAWKLYEDH